MLLLNLKTSSKPWALYLAVKGESKLQKLALHLGANAFTAARPLDLFTTQIRCTLQAKHLCETSVNVLSLSTPMTHSGCGDVATRMVTGSRRPTKTDLDLKKHPSRMLELAPRSLTTLEIHPR